MFEKSLGVDVEWAIDGLDQNIYIIQTRPETIHSNNNVLEVKKYILREKSFRRLLILFSDFILFIGKGILQKLLKRVEWFE